MHRIALSTARAPVAAAAAAAYYGSRPREAACDPQLVPHPERHDRRGELLFGVPKKGRLHEKIVGMLKGAGLEYKREARLDIAHCRDLPVSLVFLPAADIATYVGEGDVDMGITGEDIIAESEVDVIELMRLGMGKCRLSVQAPAGSTQDPRQLAGKRVVTSFPVLTKKYFAGLETGAETKVKCISGSVEASCGLGLADGIVDLVETGTTMRAAGLEIVAEVLKTEAVFIANPRCGHPAMVERLKKRIEGHLTATRYQMVQYNVHRDNMPKVAEITPGKRAPTVSPLDTDGWCAVSALVLKKLVSEKMDALQAAGATDILVFDIANSRGF